MWAGTESGPINIYDLKSFKLTQTLNTHAGGVYIIAATAAGVFTGSSDWTIIHWLPDGTQKRMLSDHANSVRSLLCIGSQTLWSGSDDHTIRVWDIPTGQCTHVLEGHTGGVLSLVTTGHTVVSGSEDGTLCVWSLNTSKPQCLKQVACQVRLH